MHEEEIKQLFHSPAGFLGPFGIEWASDRKDSSRPILLVDKALEGRTNLISGANKEDYHLKNLTPGKDFQPTDLRRSAQRHAGEACPNCGSPLRIDTAVEIGHIFKLGYKYSESMGARVLDKNGKEVTRHHGQLRDRHRAHSDRGYRAEQRRKWLLVAAADRAFRDRGHSHQRQG